jgi:hypothetical protein
MIWFEYHGKPSRFAGAHLFADLKRNQIGPSRFRCIQQRCWPAMRLSNPDVLIAQADAVLENTCRLRNELDWNRARARAICRRARQHRAFQLGLYPAVSISLFVRTELADAEEPAAAPVRVSELGDVERPASILRPACSEDETTVTLPRRAG